MKLIGLEEHYDTPDVLKAWQALDPCWQDLDVKPSSERDGAVVCWSMALIGIAVKNDRYRHGRGGELFERIGE